MIVLCTCSTLRTLKSGSYYYHPQWGTSITSSRRGRDQGWGNDIVEAFGSYATAASCDIAEPLSTSVEFAVYKITADSKVVAAANTDYDYSYNTTPSANPYAGFTTSSWAGLKKYVDYMLFNKKDSYEMGNNISSNVSQIQNKIHFIWRDIRMHFTSSWIVFKKSRRQVILHHVQLE